MSICTEDITRFALLQGADDIRFAHADGFLNTEKSGVLPIQSVLNGASCILVLFFGYLPASDPPSGYMALSPYYIASNRAWHAAKNLAAYIRENGANAIHDTNISAKEAALRTGGIMGANGFYYHECLGSLVCIQTVVTDAVPPLKYPVPEKCTSCGACASACSATGRIRDCLRYHINGIIPEEMRGYVYQLLGCEKCQSACPMNSREKSAPVCFSVSGLLNGEHAAQIKELAGSNMARARRLASQAALFAANTRMKELAPRMLELSQSAEEPLRTHARWAYEKLAGEENET